MERKVKGHGKRGRTFLLQEQVLLSSVHKQNNEKKNTFLSVPLRNVEQEAKERVLQDNGKVKT